ncbi:MAG: response regulator transcription factor [Solirubrobacterales bacterium]|jgi:DNA-binding response OmpR family regulator|nr:response regulator transcription factor [Solirubrobacterales bacterium]
MEAATDVLRSGKLEIHTTDGLVLAGGHVVTMSMREYRLLSALVAREGRIVPREDLYRIAWDAELRNGDRSVDVYVHKLRVKLENALPGQAFIHTHFGFGYRFKPEPVVESSHAFHKSTTTR